MSHTKRETLFVDHYYDLMHAYRANCVSAMDEVEQNLQTKMEDALPAHQQQIQQIITQMRGMDADACHVREQVMAQVRRRYPEIPFVQEGPVPRQDDFRELIAMRHGVRTMVSAMRKINSLLQDNMGLVPVDDCLMFRNVCSEYEQTVSRTMERAIAR
jgi:vancomycin resistance protein YoaR